MNSQLANDSAHGAGVERPRVTHVDAERVMREAWGITAEAEELGSNQDRNFTVAWEGNGTLQRAVLRIDNALVTDSDRDAQYTAVAAYTAANVPVPAFIPGTNGEATQTITTSGGDTYTARLSEFIDGEAMVDLGYFAPPVMRSFGSLAAASVLALADLKHPGLDRVHQWDMRHAFAETETLLGSITDPALRQRVHQAATDADAVLSLLAPDLPVQAIHGDLTDDNVMGIHREDSRVHPHTLIDFGDLSYGFRIAEIAVTLTSLLSHTGGDVFRVFAAFEAHAQALAVAGHPLGEAEVCAVWPLVVLRSALLVASGHRQTELEGDNDYAKERMPAEARMFGLATSMPLTEMIEHFAALLDLPETKLPPVEEVEGCSADPKAPPLAFLLPDLTGDIETGVVVEIDPGIESAALDAGAFLNDDIEMTLAQQAFAGGAQVAILPYGVFRLTRSVLDTFEEPETFPLVTELMLRADVTHRVSAPVSGEVTFADDEAHIIRIRIDDEHALTISGVRPTVNTGAMVRRGHLIGEAVTADGSARITVRIDRGATSREHPGSAPALTTQSRAPGLARLHPDPAPYLGLTSRAQTDESSGELERRNRIFATAQERYYEDPMQIERGWKHHLIDTTGRAYIDMVNNVTGLGHGHPAVADAVNRQMRLLGTNSRFLYRGLAEYSERLLATLPEGNKLDTVLLVNSGSEAVDLALLLAQAATRRRTIVALREAYHGWTMASDAVTTSAFDNPHALDSRPDWVHVADVPNTYRGTYRDPETAASSYLADLKRDLEQLQVEGRPVAGFICESVLGNAGGVTFPEGYLGGAYDLIREAGGVVIADEVQVGFGRMGTSFWGFEQSGVGPDIIAIAKPMGNGFPIGGVITSKTIADALSEHGQFFSSAGGNPVSCAVGLAVLDAMEVEGLQENARVVGQHLVQGFTKLRTKHPMIGPIHGQGLYLGVELIRDHTTLEPADSEADAICERLRELGIIMLTTSERSNVLKVKPPLCLTVESADAVIQALDRVLTEGW